MNKKALQEISKKISSGITPLRSNAAYWENGTIPWLKTEQLGERHIFDTFEKITQFALNDTSIKLNPVNTLSIAMYGEGRTRGNVSILKSEMTTNQACCNVVIDDKKASYEYVYYFLKSQYNQLRSLSSGVRKNLNSGDIKNFKIRLPENRSAQEKIAKVLSSLDDKIDLNNRTNAELEAMAKLLYDYWFVQFDFPISAAYAASVGRPDLAGKPYQSSGGKMVYNKRLKREIPEGWEDDSLWNIAKYYNGLAMQKFRPIDDNKLRVIKIREMNGGFSENTEYARANIPKEAVVNNGDVLFSWSATLDVKIWSSGIGALNQHIFKVTSDKYPRTFYFYELVNYLAHFKMMAERRKTTMGHITQDHLKQSRIVIPPLDLIKKIDKVIEPIFEKKLVLDEKNQKLVELRDWLLPMLMNGQVKVQ